MALSGYTKGEVVSEVIRAWGGVVSWVCVEVVRFVRCEDFLGGGHFHPALWAGFMWLWGDVGMGLCEDEGCESGADAMWWYA